MAGFVFPTSQTIQTRVLDLYNVLAGQVAFAYGFFFLCLIYESHICDYIHRLHKTHLILEILSFYQNFYTALQRFYSNPLSIVCSYSCTLSTVTLFMRQCEGFYFNMIILVT